MAYGIKCWNDLNQLTLDISGRYARLIYTAEVTGSGSVNLPELSGRLSLQWGEALESDPDYNWYFSPIVTRSGTAISWQAKVSSDKSLIVVFLYS